MDPGQPGGAITALLQRHRAGDRYAFDELVTLVYDHLRRIARAQVARAGRAETLDATGLVHEAYMQLAHETGVDWQDRGHFYAIAARAMRRILVDHARRRGAIKRGAGWRPVDLERVPASAADRLGLVLAVDEALQQLDGLGPRMRSIVECRFFAGLTEAETAEALDTPLRTVQREWTRARVWLMRLLDETPPRPGPAEPGVPPASR